MLPRRNPTSDHGLSRLNNPFHHLSDSKLTGLVRNVSRGMMHLSACGHLVSGTFQTTHYVFADSRGRSKWMQLALAAKPIGNFKLPK